jgi:hypothetical protein
VIIADPEVLATATEAVAEENMHAFAAAVHERAVIEGEVRGQTPIVRPARRNPDADGGGRYGWLLPVGEQVHKIRMPGVALAELQRVEATAPRVGVNDSLLWWNDAAGTAVPLPAEQDWLKVRPAPGRTEGL